MELAVILVTHNSAEPLDLCLGDIDEDLKPHVVIVDNASLDQTLVVAQRHGARVIANQQNIGFARAANAGARAADQRFLCFLNPDCLPSQELFLRGVQAMTANPCVSASPVLDEGTYGTLSGRQPGYTRLKLVGDMLRTNYGDNFLYRWLRARPDYHDRTWWWAHGACLFISRDLFLSLGGFDEQFFLYMEDVDLGRRLSAAGGEVVELDVRLRHLRGRSCRRVSAIRRLTLLNLGRVRYAAKYYGLTEALILGLIALPALPLRAALAR
jgi:GT2 family glycosyltransferase